MAVTPRAPRQHESRQPGRTHLERSAKMNAHGRFDASRYVHRVQPSLRGESCGYLGRGVRMRYRQPGSRRPGLDLEYRACRSYRSASSSRHCC